MFCVKCGNEYEGQFCPKCGQPAPQKRFCPKCGAYVPPVEDESKPKEDAPAAQPTIVIHNDNTNVNNNVNTVTMVGGKPKNKWVAFLLCLFLGWMGAHKFYEGKIGMGVLYLLTFGLLGIGWLVDCVLLLLKPNPYYV